MSEGMVFANGIELWYDAIGDSSAPAVLLIHSMGLQSGAWGPEVVDPLLDAGYQVIRVDNRDNGRSEWIDYARHPYDVRDMAVDMTCLLDALDVSAAHLVGFAMGAMIAQQVAIDSPDRVLSLSCIAVTTEVELARMEPKALDVFGTMLNTPPPGRGGGIEWGLAALRSMAGRGFAFDEGWWREVLRRSGRRFNLRNAHAVAMTRTPSQFERLSRCHVPALFLHSDDDPLFPHARVKELSERMPSARLHTLTGAGRDLSPAIFAEVMPDVLAHLAEASGASGAGSSVA
ncbi:MAG: alpha/beta hydrolase [Acidimicrobiia bacterium]